MLKSLVSILFIFLCINNSLGQVVIKGVLKSAGTVSLDGINIIVSEDRGLNNIISYSISDEEGKFETKVKCGRDSIFLGTRSFSYRDTIIKLANKNQLVHFFLQEQLVEIQEVGVSGYPISARGDTIVYTVKSFAQQKDISIGDVIKRMPGFEVNEQGKISYQGQPIQKYYIEGLDLLEQRYTIANRNLPYQSVSSIEVMQNHQPIKMLESKIASDGTSLNIKLEKNVAFTGTIYAGAGLLPFLYDVNITPMLFAKKQQVIASAQHNNIGTDLNFQHQPFELTINDLNSLKNKKEELLGISSIPNPQIGKYRYLDNDAWLLSYNHLLKINPDTELKINGSYYNDKIDETGSVRTSYFVDNETIIIDELTTNTYLNNNLNTELTLLQNAKKRYLKNNLILNRFWDEEMGQIQTEESIEQIAKTPHFSVANEFDLILPVKRNFIQFYSFIDYNKSEQKLHFSPGILKDELNNGDDYRTTSQNYLKQSFITHNYFQFALKKGSWIYESEAGFKYEKQQLNTIIETNDHSLNIDSLANRLNWTYSEIYLNERLKFEKSNFRFGFELPLINALYEIKDAYHQSPTRIERFYFTPLIYLKQEIGNFWTARMSVKYKYSIDEPNRLMQGYIITDYRQMSRQTNKLSEKQTYSYSVGIEYKNPISGLFSNLVWYSTQSSANLLIQHQMINEGLWYNRAVESDNIIHSDNLTLGISKFLSKIRTTVDIKSSYNRLRKDYLFNDLKRTSDVRALIIIPSMSSSIWRFLDLGYSYQYQFIVQNSAETNISFNGEMHIGSIFINFSKNNQLGLVCEYYQSMSDLEAKSNTFFFDLNYYYKPMKGKFRFRLKGNNIFNQSEIVKYYNNDISVTKSSYQIRPRQFMITVFYNL